MCSNCNNNEFEYGSWKGAVVMLLFVAVMVLALCWSAPSRGAEVKAVPLAQINQAESPVIAKAMGINRPESHDIPKFDLPPAGEAAAVAGIGIAALFLFVLQLTGIAVTTIVVVVVGVWASRKFFGGASAAKAAIPLLASLDKLVASHRANNLLAKAVHSRLAKIGVIAPLAPIPKKPRKKKSNAPQNSVA